MLTHHTGVTILTQGDGATYPMRDSGCCIQAFSSGCLAPESVFLTISRDPRRTRSLSCPRRVLGKVSGTRCWGGAGMVSWANPYSPLKVPGLLWEGLVTSLLIALRESSAVFPWGSWSSWDPLLEHLSLHHPLYTCPPPLPDLLFACNCLPHLQEHCST